MSRNDASETDERQLPSIMLRRMRIHCVTEEQAVHHIVSCLNDRVGGWAVTPNLDILRRYERDPEFRRLIEPATLMLADGMPLIWASRIQGQPLPERVAGSNLIHSLTAAAAKDGKSVFFLGGDPGTAEEAATILTQRNPGLTVAGHLCPPFGFENDEAMLSSMIQQLVDAEPDIVYVALGSPKQEQFILRARAHLPHAWHLGLGISFSFVAGRVRRAPAMVQRFGLEWMHRLVQEPRRLGRRYLVEGIPFAARLFCGAVGTRLTGRAT